jgi:hypothetical protein
VVSFERWSEAFFLLVIGRQQGSWFATSCTVDIIHTAPWSIKVIQFIFPSVLWQPLLHLVRRQGLMPNVLTVGCPSVFGRISNLGNGREGLSVRENRFDIRVRLDTDSVLVRLSGQWLELIFVSIRQVACVYWQG